MNGSMISPAASMLLLALIFYLHYEAPEEEQNFAMVMEMLRAAAIEDEEDNRPSPLDNLFEIGRAHV